MCSSEESGGGMRRRRRVQARGRVVKFRLGEDEYAAVVAPARRGGWSCGAFVAQAALDAARGERLARSEAVREALADMMRTTGQLSKIGSNLNQAVAKLNSTGHCSGELPVIADYCGRLMRRLDDLASRVGKRLA